MVDDATWDDLDTIDWDRLWTWDDPYRNGALDVAYARGEVVMDASQIVVDWIGDVPNPDLSPSLARDEFVDVVAVTDGFNRTLASALGSTDNGLPYTTLGGSASDYSVDGDEMVLTLSTVNVSRRAQLNSVSLLNFSLTVTGIAITSAPLGAGGTVEQKIRGRNLDDSNFVDLRLIRNVTGNNVTIAVRHTSAGSTVTSSNVAIPGATVASSVDVMFVARGNTLQGYACLTGQAMPTTPLVTIGSVAMLSAGGVELNSFANTSVTNPPLTTKFGNLSVLGQDLVTTSVGAHPWNVVAGPSNFSKAGGLALLRPTAVNVYYLAVVNDIVEADFDIAMRVRATTVFTGFHGSILVFARYQDANNWLRFRLDFNPDLVMGWGIEINVAGSTSEIDSGLFDNIQHDTSAWLWVRVQGWGRNIRLKAYPDGVVVPKAWEIYSEDPTFFATPGRSGWGGYLATGNSNTLPYVEFQAETYWQGANSLLDNGRIAVGLSLDDGMPSAVTNTANIGVNEVSADLLGPIGTAPDIYFSTFRTDQPFSDLPRDVAGVGISGQVLADDGVRPVRLFTGQMADIPIDDQSAKLQALSAARLALSAPVQPPAVHGYYEGGEATWVIGYTLFKCGLYVAPKPLDGCRLYLPMNGTTHSYIPDDNRGAASISGVRFIGQGNGIYDRPRWMDGPFTAAPDLFCDARGVRKIQNGPGLVWLAPGADFMSQSGYRGRIEAWVKGIPTDAAGSLNTGQGDLFMVRIRNSTAGRYAALIVRSDRQIRMQLSDGTLAFFYAHSNLPVDNKWHYIAGYWDLGPTGSTVVVRVDGITKAQGSALSYGNLPVVEDATIPDMQTCLPAVEIRMSSGVTASKADWPDLEPFTPDVVMRRSILNVDGVAETEAREAFELLSSYAQAELARTGFDGEDRYQYLPLTYWAEPEQQAVQETLSAETNIGQKFKPVRDVRKIFNQVSLGYRETQVQENWSTVYQSSLLAVVPPGQSIYVEAPFSAPAIEMRSLTFSVMSGTALAAAPPSASNAISYITLNDAYDGSGTYATTADVSAAIASWHPGAARVIIKNLSGKTWYLSNNVNLPPLGLAAKAVQAVDATVSAEHSASIAQRGRRVLPVTLDAIQNRTEAQRMAQILVSLLASPRVTLTTDVFPDIRREPGQLYQVSDQDGTGISQAFRLTGVSTSQDGADVQQVVGMEQAWPIAVWGQTNWGEGIWGP